MQLAFYLDLHQLTNSCLIFCATRYLFPGIPSCLPAYVLSLTHLFFFWIISHCNTLSLVYPKDGGEILQSVGLYVCPSVYMPLIFYNINHYSSL